VDEAALHELLRALQAMRAGDFGVRVAARRASVMGDLTAAPGARVVPLTELGAVINEVAGAADEEAAG
jgi:hypothetical protein